MQLQLPEITRGVERLRNVIITVMPDCLLYESWSRDGDQTANEEAASYLGDLVRANREALRVMRALSDEMQVTIESGGLLIILREIESSYVVGFVFESDVPLGMVRVQVRTMLARITEALPRFAVSESSRGERVLEFVERYAPDPHTVLLRVAVQARVPLDELRNPANLDGERMQRVERAVCTILGIDSLTL